MTSALPATFPTLATLHDPHAEKAQESANYFRACSALKSPFQATAAANLKRIMTEYHGIK